MKSYRYLVVTLQSPCGRAAVPACGPLPQRFGLVYWGLNCSLCRSSGSGLTLCSSCEKHLLFSSSSVKKFHQLLAVGRWFPPGTPVSSTRKLISSSFHRLDMTLAVAEALNPNKPKPGCVLHSYGDKPGRMLTPYMARFVANTCKTVGVYY